MRYVHLKVYLDDVKIKDSIEIVIAKTKHIPIIKSSKKVVKKRPNIVVNQNLEKQDIFCKENIETAHK